MIGYYVHHVGQGHAFRAATIAAALPAPVTALSSLPRPGFWTQDWVGLPSDEEPKPCDPTAGGVLHWTPRRSTGLSHRMAALAGWIDDNQPSVFVSDLSVEVTVLARLLGVPVVTTTLPGRRDDRGHRLGYELADAILAPWPELDSEMVVGLADFRAKLHFVGGMSRFDGRPIVPAASTPTRRALALNGTGGAEFAYRTRTGDWQWVRRDRRNWTDDVWPDLCAADVVVSHCGLGALSDVAAARKPAVLLPQPRPHDEQYRTARALARHGLALTLSHEPEPTEWPEVLDRARVDFDANQWTTWSPGDAAARAADVIMAVAESA